MVLKFGIACVGTTFPVTHQGHVVLAQLTTPVELERHFSSTACIIDSAWLMFPVTLFKEVETRRCENLILEKELTVLRENVCRIVDVATTTIGTIGNTTVALVELVVP